MSQRSFAPHAATALLCGLAALFMLIGTCRADAPRIANPKEPPLRETRELREVWRIGPDDEDVLLGVVTGAVQGPDGRIYLLDTQLTQIVVMSPDGEYLDTLSRQGEGPGEMQMPIGLCLMEDDMLGVVQMMPGRIVLLDTEGVPGPLFQPDVGGGGFAMFLGAKSRAGSMLLSATSAAFADGKVQTVTTMSSIGSDGSELHRIVELPQEVDPANISIKEADGYIPNAMTSAIGPGGEIYYAPSRDVYRIDVIEPTGEPVRIIERDFERLKRTDDERADLPAVADVQQVQIEYAEYNMAIMSLNVTDAGELWVLNGESDRLKPDGVFRVFDVFAADGRLRSEVSLRCAGDIRRDGLIWLDGRRFLLLKNSASATSSFANSFAGVHVPRVEDEDAEPLEVICYEMAD